MKTPLTSSWFQQWLTRTDQSEGSQLDATPSVQTQTLFPAAQTDRTSDSGALQKRIKCGLFSWGEQLTYLQRHTRPAQ